MVQLVSTISTRDVQLGKVNDAMNEVVSSTSVGANGHPSTTLHHTMKRHNDILQDYNREFGRTKVLYIPCDPHSSHVILTNRIM